MHRVAFAVLLFLPSSSRAQSAARLTLLEDWRHQQRLILAVIDSATPGMLDFRTTPGVRTFGEQVYHIARVAGVIVGQAVAERPLPAEFGGDSTVYLHDKAALRTQTERYLQFVITSLEPLTDEELSRDRAFAGGTMPRWRWNLTALQHSAWTLGQLVPYLRMNHRVPPQFTPF